MISHYKAQLRNPVFFLMQVGAILGPITYNMGRPERLLVFPLGVLVLWWLKTLIFSYEVRVSRQGIVAESQLWRRIMGWSEVERVVHKGGAYSNGYRYHEKVILSGPHGRIVLDGSMTGFEMLCEQIDVHLRRETSVSIAEAREEFRLADLVIGPSSEDLAESLLSFVCCALIVFALLY